MRVERTKNIMLSRTRAFRAFESPNPAIDPIMRTISVVNTLYSRLFNR
jgi:hypothetical protein